jgi:hypothetical protein
MAIMLTAPSLFGLPMTDDPGARDHQPARELDLDLDEVAVPRIARGRRPAMRISFCLRSTGTSRAPSSSMRTMPIWPRRGLSRIFIALAV